MSDIAFDLMREKIQAHQGSGLWVVDENISSSAIASIAPSASLITVTNRSDIAEALEVRGFTVWLNDFDFSAVESQTIDAIYYRVSKEKPVVHHIINQAARVLKDGAYLHLSGYKNEGGKTYIEKAGKYLGQVKNKVLGGKTSIVASICCDAIDESKKLDDKAYKDLRNISSNDVALLSKPGVFGWQKIDRGSAYLIEHLPAVLENITAPIECVVDLGCGYGYLSVMASQLLEADFYAVDNNVAAVRSCKENFKCHGISGDATLDSCGDALQAGVDMVICNPPFHQGFDVESGLTDRFVASTARLLKKGAVAFFVVNAFIPLESKAKKYFDSVQLIDNNKSFKLLLLKK